MNSNTIETGSYVDMDSLAYKHDSDSSVKKPSVHPINDNYLQKSVQIIPIEVLTTSQLCVLQRFPGNIFTSHLTDLLNTYLTIKTKTSLLNKFELLAPNQITLDKGPTTCSRSTSKTTLPTTPLNRHYHPFRSYLKQKITIFINNQKR